MDWIQILEISLVSYILILIFWVKYKLRETIFKVNDKLSSFLGSNYAETKNLKVEMKYMYDEIKYLYVRIASIEQKTNQENEKVLLDKVSDK